MAHEFWYGDTESHQAVLQARAEVRNLMMATADARDLPELPPMWSREKDVATVRVHGSLITGTAGFMRLWGVTGYDDVVNAAIEATADSETKKVLLHVESPGGATNGLSEVGEILTKLGKVKPIHAHTEQIAASAGYWIMCSAGSLSANQTAQVGSIGCIATMTSTIRAYEEMGIDKKVVRSGEYKGLGNPAEPISALAEADLQSKVNDLAAMFESWVAKRRDVSAATVKNDMGQGRVFLGRRALEANLVDKILTYDQVLRMIEKS
jgi:signal peptide peptidase SppA